MQSPSPHSLSLGDTHGTVTEVGYIPLGKLSVGPVPAGRKGSTQTAVFMKGTQTLTEVLGGFMETPRL